MKTKLGHLAKACLLLVAAGGALASSHREAPFITTAPKVDGTDFYMFRSYEGIAANGTGGRSDYVTLLANYQPLQAPYGGPNYFQLDPNALYEIHIDNTGDGVEDITFQFRFKNSLKSIPLPIGAASVPIPLIQAGAVSNLNDANLNVNETYTVNIVRGDRRKGSSTALVKTGGSATFEKPVDYIGVKTLGDTAAYAAYAGKHIHTVTIPGCPAGTDQGKVFVGQRQEGFAVNDKAKAIELETWLNSLQASFSVLDISVSVYRRWAKLTHRKPDHHDQDAMIAATALEHDLTVVTRNIKDFKSYSIPLLDPFKSA